MRGAGWSAFGAAGKRPAPYFCPESGKKRETGGVFFLNNQGSSFADPVFCLTQDKKSPRNVHIGTLRLCQNKNLLFLSFYRLDSFLGTSISESLRSYL
jgi:hypothetical protein